MRVRARARACLRACALLVRARVCARVHGVRLAVVWLQVVPCYFCWSELKLLGCYLVLFGYCWVFLGCH